MPEGKKPKPESGMLKGWQQIAAFLGQPLSVVQRWADSGMPVEKRGRYVYSSRTHLNQWLGHESAGEPVQIATEATDLSAELKRGLSFVRKQDARKPKKKAA
jgi:phage terminase Nu1 subunit (DNA packaging protein)